MSPRLSAPADSPAAPPVGDDGHAHAGASARRRPRVVVVLARGETLRAFVYSGALTSLARSADVTLLTVLPTPETRAALERSFRSVVELTDARDIWAVRFLRDLIDMAHGRWLWSEAAQERWRLRDAEATSTAARAKRIGRKLLCAPFANRRGLAWLSALEATGSRWFNPTDRFERLYAEVRPDLVFNASHVHSSNAVHAVQTARWLGIPTATFIFSWDNLTSQGRILRPYDHYLVWNAALRRQLLEMYPEITAPQVSVTGTPQFDFHFRTENYWSRAEFCAHVGADASRPIVLYSTGMPNHMPGEPQIVEGIARRLRRMTEFGPPQLLVRVYPKDRTGRFDELKAANPDVLFPHIPWDPEHQTPRPEDGPLLTNMLRHAAVGVNVASTVSLELCMFDRPVVNVGYNPPNVDVRELEYARYYRFDHYKVVVDSGAVDVARSEAELEALLRQALATPQARAGARRAFLAQMFGDTLDGHSSDRVAAQLLDLARVRSNA